VSTADAARLLAQRLAALRGHARLSRRELGQRAGVSHAYIGKLERAAIENPGGQRLDQLARALGWPDYHAMLASDELDAPRPAAAAEPEGDALRAFEARQQALLAHWEGLVQEARADYAAVLRLVQALVDRDRRAGGPASASRS
jgi:transcriptional regulator with XRE-family HTH domain